MEQSPKKEKTNFAVLKEKIIDFIKINGPSLPVKLSRAIGSDITFAGAVLSELVANKKLSISNAKIGGSPVYYLPGQEERLSMLEDYLHSKEKDAFRLLRDKKLIRDNEALPWQRVALKEIRDFAIPINVVTEDGRNEVFWKWYMLGQDETKKLVASFLEKSSQKEHGMDVKENKEVIVPVVKEVEREEIVVKPEDRQEVLEDFFLGQSVVEVSKKTAQKEKKQAVKKIKNDKTVEFSSLDNYLTEKGIEVLSREENKKGKEVDMIAYVPSELGKIKFLLAYRDKKRVNENEVGFIFGKAQVKNVPAILITKGELTKKAKELIEKDFKSVTFYRI